MATDVNEWRLSVMSPPSIPEPMTFTNKNEDEKIVFYVDGTVPVRIFELYRIASCVLQLTPATSDLGSRLLGQANNEPFWNRSIEVNRIILLYPDGTQEELGPALFKTILNIYNHIRTLGEQRGIDLLRHGNVVTVKLR